MSDTTQPPYKGLKTACKAFLEASETMDASMVDGVNVQGVLGALIAAAEKVKEEADSFCEGLDRPTYEKNVQGIMQAA